MISRFSSFNYAPSETRRILRDRFVSKLMYVDQHRRFCDSNLEATPDVLVLRVLANLRIYLNADWLVAEATYSEANPTANEPPDLNSLVSLGWLRRIWGRVEIGSELRLAIRRAMLGNMEAFNILLSGIHDRRYQAGDALRADPELAGLVEVIEAENNEVLKIIIQTPEWIAARLWEQTLAQEVTSDSALRRWTDLWGLLQHPSLVPGEIWSATDAKVFREVAFRTIETEPSLGGWKETRELYVKQAALAQNVTVPAMDVHFPPPPNTLVDRALWVLSRPIEANAYNSLESCGDLFGLVRLLLADAEAENNSPAPHTIVARIVDMAIDRAELFMALLFQIQNYPRLLADLVIHPPSSGLACLLIAQWRMLSGAWDRTLIERDHQIGQAETFADAVSILGEHLRTGKTNASEAAALLNWLHDQAGRGFIDDLAGTDSLITILRREFANCDNSTMLAMTQALDGPGLQSGVGTSEFAAVLDLCFLGGIEGEVDADTIVTAYSRSIATGDYSLSTHRIGALGANSLARIAERSLVLRNQFLYPLDVRTRLANVGPEDNEFVVADSIARSLRTHIRILCRAIIGGTADVPDDLFKALVSAIRAGALQHREKGRIAAFAPRFEKSIGVSASDRPLAADLAAALMFVYQSQQDTLLAVILETDEPLILAQLLSKSPPNLHSDIERRIAALAPIDAGTIYSLTEMQARIDVLLSVGAADAAESYMAAEIELKTLGKPEGRELIRFQNQLRLQFLREDWAGIVATADPSFSSLQNQAIAVETLQQFRALTALKGPNPNPERAKTVFVQLFNKRPSLGFATNWFAAEINELLQADSFGLLKGDQIRKGLKAIAEVERMTALLPAASTDEALECNRALLLLALAEPSQALAVLSAVTLIHLQDTAAAYRAVALFRLGRRSEATAVLDSAEHTFGRTSVLTAARSHIANGAPYLSVPDISIHDDLVGNVASAIARFRMMNPADQARVLQPQADPFEAVLIDYVRFAADAVVSLVPMMKGVQIDAIEDDLNAFIQHLLGARVHFLNWSVGDQSKGGFSGQGNAGERDLLITWGGSVLALIEAVICDSPLTQDAMKADLESHFQKLLGYGNPRIFFHLTYAYIDDKQGLMQFLETAAETAAPLGFTYIGREVIPHEDSRPPGFVARYSGDFGEVKVVFIVLNLGQQRQRRAAKTADVTKHRKAPVRPKKVPLRSLKK